jgi:hypothetical protein
MKRSVLACVLLTTAAVFTFLDCREKRKCHPRKVSCSVSKKNKKTCFKKGKNRQVGKKRCKKGRNNIRMNRFVSGVIKNKC